MINNYFNSVVNFASSLLWWG